MCVILIPWGTVVLLCLNVSVDCVFACLTNRTISEVKVCPTHMFSLQEYWIFIFIFYMN